MPDSIHDLPVTNVCLVETPAEPVESVCVAGDDWDLDLDFQPSSTHAVETAPEPKHDEGGVDVCRVEMPDSIHDLPVTNVCLVETPAEPVESVCVAGDDWDIDVDFQPSSTHAVETAPEPKHDDGGVDVCHVEMPDSIHDLPVTNVCLVETPAEPVESVCVAADDWDFDLDFQPSSTHAVETALEPKHDDGGVCHVEMPDSNRDLPGTNVCLVETPAEPVASVCVAGDDWDFDLDFEPSSATNGNSSVSIAWLSPEDAKRPIKVNGSVQDSCQESACDMDPLLDPGTITLEIDSSRPHPAKDPLPPSSSSSSKHLTKLSPPRRTQQPLVPVGLPRRKPHKADHLDLDDLLNF
ncbi:MAG: hypothetical protein KVP17_003378 [Porospora cf. gigantea B]|uniref:uncharacterized protein n=1 Tax=Porospora cf. gigantea B TaxID=2853592 RepID=UPI0035719BD8|nr:MAG: hypothetical protein KVP17_003378 [Porospora cf. gigantea B]